MKRLTYALLATLMLTSILSASDAPRTKVGVGLILGAPTGFSVKYWQSSQYAFQGAVGSAFKGISIGADYLIHTNAFNKSNAPFYYGPGVFFGSAGLGGPSYSRGDLALGGRFVFGVDYIFPDHPFDLAFELGPALLLTPNVGIGVEVGIAFRFYP